MVSRVCKRWGTFFVVEFALLSFSYYFFLFCFSSAPQLLALANKFTIRRTNAILAMYLPVKSKIDFLSVFYFLLVSSFLLVSCY